MTMQRGEILPSDNKCPWTAAVRPNPDPAFRSEIEHAHWNTVPDLVSVTGRGDRHRTAACDNPTIGDVIDDLADR
jgi:hypothetical protein